MAANHRRTHGDLGANVPTEEFADALPIIVLSCIDPRLNRLLPTALGLPEDQVIWLRNAGNIIFDSMSSMTRTLALACAVKRGREIAIIGHTDCQVGKASILDITDRFRALGIDRAGLPDNLNEFFGLFASERQNVLRGCDLIRRSPLIGPKVPVHGLLLEIDNGRFEWLVNGYEQFATVASPIAATTQPASSTPTQASTVIPTATVSTNADASIGSLGAAADHRIGELPEVTAPAPQPSAPISIKEATKEFAQQVKEAALREGSLLLGRAIDKALHYTVIGSDEKTYGPVTGEKLLEWIAKELVTEQTKIRVEGSSKWHTLTTLAKLAKPPPIKSGRSIRQK